MTCAPETPSVPDATRAKLAGATELPSATGERVTEPPAGTNLGGSCTLVTGAPDASSTRPEPPAAIESTAAGTSTSPVLEIRTVRGTLWPLEARDREGEAAIARAAGLRAAPEEAEAGCATKVRPESALTPDSATVTFTGAPGVSGVTEKVWRRLAPAARASDAAAGETVPSVAEMSNCALPRSTSPSLRKSIETVTGTPTSTIPGSESSESAGAGPPRTVSARRIDTGEGGSPRWATAVPSSSSHPGPTVTPCIEPLSERAEPAASVAPETDRFAVNPAEPPAVTSTLT